jgi:amino acid adenylation domain-containing protein/non-ribosomal peptide synthase protein (TIGR01720 family)
MGLAKKSGSKLELLKQLLIKHASENKVSYPLSYGQRALWFLYKTDPQSHAYNLAFSIRIKAPIDIPALKRALQKLSNRHFSLRTTFSDNEGELVQTVHGYQELSFERLDAFGLAEEELYDRVLASHRRPFNLENGPLMRIHLFTCLPNNHVLLITAHHIIMDFSSFVILNEELWQLYGAEIDCDSTLFPAPSVQYIEYVNWQRDLIESPKLDRQWYYWREIMAGELTALSLPEDYTRPSIQTYNGASIPFTINKEITQKIKECAAEEGVTLFVFLLSAFQLFLHRYSGQDDIIVGIPTNGRFKPEFKKIIGYLINMLAIRTDFSGNLTLRELLCNVRDSVFNALKYQDFPFMLLVERLQPKRDPSRSPLFQVTFELLQMSSLLSDESGDDAFKSVSEQYDISQQEGQFDVMLTMVDARDSFSGTFHYNTDLFKQDTVTDMVKHFKILIEEVAGNADKPVSDLSLLSERQVIRLLRANNTKTEYPRDQCVHQLFEMQVKRSPENIAVSEGGNVISFAALNQRANQLANLLRRKGVGQGTIVGIMAPRSIECVIGIIAILKAGGAYLPIDPKYPKERINYMLEDSRAKVLLTQKGIEPAENFEGIRIDLDNEENYLEDSVDLDCMSGPNDLAYLIYTSGSTGRPKGAMIAHQGVVNYIHWAIKQYGRKDRTGLRFPFYSSIAFDLTVTSLFVPLLSGNRMEIYADDDFALDQILKEDKVDIIKLTPSHLKTLLMEDYSPKNLRSFIIGGEELERKLAAKISAKFNHEVILYNEYGPTETVVGCMIYAYDPNKDKGLTIPIGVPADNVQLYVFDRYQRLVPDKVVGELYVGGDGVCKGYLNRKELTDEKFIENPYIKGDRIYRTGDLAKRSDRIFEYLGRVDQQVKIRGYRIECGEVEGNILNIGGIDHAAVVMKENENREKFLCCYYVSAGGITGEQIKDRLSKRLPHYMIPAKCICKESMPLNRNGKIDRKLLQDEAITNGRQEKFLAPRNQLENKLSEIWKKVLKIKTDIGIEDNFFSIGGNSLLAIQVLQQARKVGMNFKAGDILEHPTIAKLSAKIGRSDKVDELEAAKVVAEKVALTPIQMSFLTEFVDVSHYNQYVVININKKINKAHLEKALQALLIHHDILRAYYLKKDRQWVQLIGPYNEYSFLTTYDLSKMKKNDQQERWRQIVAENQGRFDLADPPLMFANYFALGTAHGVLVISIHHLVIDFFSNSIIIEDFITAYNQLQNGMAVCLPDQSVSFQTWANTLMKYAENNTFVDDIKYWCSEAMNNAAKLPVDYQDAHSFNKEAFKESFVLTFDRGDTKKLVADIADSHSFQAYEMVLACLIEALYEWTGNNRFLINFEGHGRREIDGAFDLSRTVGWLSGAYPVLFSLDENNEDPAKSIDAIKKDINKVPNNGFNYGLLKYLKKNKEPERLVKPEIDFNYLGRLDNAMVEDETFEFKYCYMSSAKTNHLPYLLKVDCAIIAERLSIIIIYSEKVFKQATIRYLADHLKKSIIKNTNLLLNKEEEDSVVCKRCVLPDTFPGTEIDENGICKYCRASDSRQAKALKDFKDENDLIKCLSKYKRHKKYDVLVPLSGGVDSSSALIDIVNKYGLKPLGFHNDHGYEDETATNNCRKLCQALNVDLMIKQHDLSFMKKLWRYTNQSNVKGLSTCFVCGGILYANAVELADRYEIPLIINGYSKGQAQMMANKATALAFWEEMLEHFQQDETFLAEFLERQKPMSKQKVYLSREDLAADIKQDTILVIPFYIFKFHKTDKEMLKKKCREIFDWQPMKASYPGRTTNCEMVWLNTYMDLKRMKYTMYHEEYAGLVRKGEISREQALRDLEFNPPKGVIEKLAKDINYD